MSYRTVMVRFDVFGPSRQEQKIHTELRRAISLVHLSFVGTQKWLHILVPVGLMLRHEMLETSYDCTIKTSYLPIALQVEYDQSQILETKTGGDCSEEL